MGVDLIGEKDENAYFHSNWYGWRLIRSMLTAAGADTEDMPFSNDGELVEEETCIEWAEKLEKFIKETKGYKVSLRGKDSTEYTVLARSEDEAIAVAMMIWYDDDKKMKVEVTEADKTRAEDVTEFILEFTEFLKKCGGFRCY